MIPKSAVSSLLFLSVLIVTLPFALQSTPHGPSDRPTLPGALPFSMPGQTGQGGLPHRAPFTPRDLTRGARRTTASAEVSSSSWNPTFLAPPTYPTGGYYAYSIAVADVNGDGNPDLVVANECASSDTCEYAANATVSVLLGNGNGTLQAALTYATGGYYAYSVAVADVNGDGKPDLVVANRCATSSCTNGSVGVLLGNGDGTFQTAVAYGTGGQYAYSVAIADVNGDGKPDLVVTNECATSSCTNGSVSVLLGNGDGTFQTALTYGTGGQYAYSVAVADVNGDGKPDLVVANEVSNTLGVLLGNGDGTFQTALTYGTGGQDAYSVAIADVNGDGKPDLVVANEGSNTLGVLLGNGDGTFQTAVSYGTGGQYAYSVAIADVNGDGKPDLVVANEGSNNLGVLLGNGDGTFQAAVIYGTGGPGALSVAVADVNLDGKPDLVVANMCASSSCTNGSVSLLLGNGDGTFQTAPNYGTGAQDAYSVAVADVNGDGNPDLVVANECSTCANGSVSVLLGNGDGTFQPAVTYGTGGQYAFSVAIADVNGDGKPDLVVANGCVSSSDCANGTVSVLLGNGDGTFQTALTYGTGGQYAYSVAIADVNLDGKPDLLVTNECAASSCANGTVSVLLGNGDGTFQTAVSYASGGQDAYSVAVADVNGDGKPDLVVANEGSNNVGVLLGNGDGTFQTAVSYGTGGQYAFSVSIADVNGDGKPDLAVANGCASSCTNGAVSVLLGNGDGTFQTAVSTSTPYPLDFPASLALADFNGDGYLDVVSGSGSVLLLGNGDGTFQSPITLGAFGLGVAAADFNGDGKPDLAVASGGSVAILINISTIVASSPNPASLGQTVTFAATVAGKFGGNVTFTNGSATLCSKVTLSSGKATCAYSALPVGSQIVTATYSGDNNLITSKGSINQTVGKASTKLTLSSSANPSGLGQPVTFTAAIKPQYGGQASGTVTFLDGTTTLGSAAVSGNAASLTTSSLAAGKHSITATYGGDSSLTGSTSSVLSQVVTNSTSTTTLVSSVNPSEFGKAVTFTATITSTAGTPTGTVQFLNGATVLAKVTISSGSAKYTTAKLPAGSNTITALYSGDSSSSGSTSAAVDQVVLALTTTKLTSSPNPSSNGQAVVFTAKVASTSGTPPNGEIVTFKQGTTVLGTGSLNDGSASFTTSTLKVGTTSVTAEYGGDASSAGSTSKAVSQVVSKATTTTALTSSVNPSKFGQSVTFTATVAPQFSGTPTGTVTFNNGSTKLGTVSLSGGVASYTTTKLAVGTEPITAVYNGSTSFTTSTSSALSQAVNQANTTTTLVSSLNPSNYKQAVTFTATVTPQFGGTVTGTVAFYNGTTKLETVTLSEGKAKFTTSTLAAGSNSITATYESSTSFDGSSSTPVTQTVN